MIKRAALAGLTLSAAALVGIVAQEGYSDKAIIPVKGDVPTIGFGTTGGVRMGDTITPPKALARALQDVQKYEGAIKRCITVPLHQYEYDAYTSLAYNIGPTAFCNSSLVRKLNTEDYPGACGEIMRWAYYQGKNCAAPEYARLCGGLAKRRESEYRQCVGAAPALTQTLSQRERDQSPSPPLGESWREGLPRINRPEGGPPTGEGNGHR
ncbi:MAG: lysozyme [Sulfuricellaceae bacterium]|nr:lysozyme [Sulfuricellaceae bacterium]